MADVISQAGEGSATPEAARALADAARRAGEHGLPPVHLWNPPFCGDIGMKIARDGTWFYRGSPIARPSLVKLFASILRKDTERHVLVTPVEMVSVEVEDAPFVAVEMRREERAAGQTLVFRTNVGDETRAGPDAPLRFERGAGGAFKPYVLVRGDLWALVTRALSLDLVELGEVRDVDGRAMFGVPSGGAFFPMAPADELEASP